VTNALTLQSVNGREVTIMNGNYPNVTNRCFYLSAGGAMLDGFILTNGCSTNGGGVYQESGTTVQNCRITGCIATNISSVNSYGGGAYIRIGGVMTNCEVIGNISHNNHGGGIYVPGGTVVNCVIACNQAGARIGSAEILGCGIRAGAKAVVSNCRIYENTYKIPTPAVRCLGGGVSLYDGVILRNSLVYDNNATKGGGVVVANYGYIQNCTVVSNRVTDLGEGCYGGGIMTATRNNLTTCLQNVICYFNSAATGTDSNFFNEASGVNTGSLHVVNSCIAPTNTFPTSGIEGYYYAGNIESDPQFADKDNNNFRLAQDSPCVNAGTNQDWMTNAVDLDGAARIRYGRVDMGAYERIYHGVVYGVR
jgi:hypothetical protein